VFLHFHKSGGTTICRWARDKEVGGFCGTRKRALERERYAYLCVYVCVYICVCVYVKVVERYLFARVYDKSSPESTCPEGRQLQLAWGWSTYAPTRQVWIWKREQNLFRHEEGIVSTDVRRSGEMG